MIWLQSQGFLEVLDFFLLFGGYDAADVVLQGVQANGWKLCNELLFRNIDGQIQRIQHVPGQGRLYSDQAGQWPGFDKLRTEPELAEIHDLGISGEGIAIKVVAPHHHIVCINLLCNLIDGGP